jgi:predicted Rossmann fold flavoprotein
MCVDVKRLISEDLQLILSGFCREKQKMKHTEIAIIGGGAAGLAAAATLSKANKYSVIIERNPRVGKKLLATGNGRCNLGHSPLSMSNYHGDVDLLREVFRSWKGAESFFAELGLVCKKDDAGRCYPYSNTANSVLDSLRFACVKTEFICDTECRDIESFDGGFVINSEIRAKKVIWACGSHAGTAEPDFSILERLGHSIVKPFPSLCPIITERTLTKPLKGLRVHAVCNAVVNGKTVKSEQGEVQFNDGSLSGICIMNLSRLVKDYGTNLTVSLDIAPEFTVRELKELRLTGLFHRRIAEILADKPIETVKDWRFPAAGTAPWSKAQIMSGGVPGCELNYDLSSKICPDLYIIGESVNVDGDCGGYNLEWAWASAAKAVTP